MFPAGFCWAIALCFFAEFVGAAGGTIQAGAHYGWLRTLISIETLVCLTFAPGGLLLWLSGLAFLKRRWREGSIRALLGFCLGLVGNIFFWQSLAPYRN